MGLKKRPSTNFERLRSISQWHILLIEGPDLETLIELTGEARKSRQARKQLRDFVEGLHRRNRSRLNKVVGLLRGRPSEKRSITELALAYREKHPGVSFGRLAQMFDPQYQSNRRNAADRMRLNMEYHLKREIARLNEKAAYWRQKAASIREKST